MKQLIALQIAMLYPLILKASSKDDVRATCCDQCKNERSISTHSVSSNDTLSNSGIIQAMANGKPGDYVEFIVMTGSEIKARFRFTRTNEEWVGSFQYPLDYHRIRNIIIDPINNKIDFQTPSFPESDSEETDDFEEEWHPMTIPGHMPILKKTLPKHTNNEADPVVAQPINNQNADESNGDKGNVFKGEPKTGRMLNDMMREEKFDQFTGILPTHDGNRVVLAWNGEKFIGLFGKGNIKKDITNSLWFNDGGVLLCLEDKTMLKINANDSILLPAWAPYRPVHQGEPRNGEELNVLIRSEKLGNFIATIDGIQVILAWNGERFVGSIGKIRIQNAVSKDDGNVLLLLEGGQQIQIKADDRIMAAWIERPVTLWAARTRK